MHVFNPRMPTSQHIAAGIAGPPVPANSGIASQGQKPLAEWNETRVSFPQSVCIHHLVEQQAERIPERTAVQFGRRRLTYAELNLRSNQLANRLRKEGVGPEVLVGICMERSLEMVVGLLGILKAGGAYVPIDPVYPKDRIKYVLDDSAAQDDHCYRR